MSQHTHTRTRTRAAAILSGPFDFVHSGQIQTDSAILMRNPPTRARKEDGRGEEEDAAETHMWGRCSAAGTVALLKGFDRPLGQDDRSVLQQRPATSNQQPATCATATSSSNLLTNPCPPALALCKAIPIAAC